MNFCPARSAWQLKQRDALVGLAVDCLDSGGDDWHVPEEVGVDVPAELAAELAELLRYDDFSVIELLFVIPLEVYIDGGKHILKTY